ncbi:MAG TPA: hypothetical protein VN704_06875 [Verrucomicrobiae bacterium]|nr:hypothetical protein [Verrucomicrobiae bacterium]
MNHNNLPIHNHQFQTLNKKKFTIKNSFIFTTIGIILMIGLTNINFFEHTFAQSPSNTTNNSSTIISSPSTTHSGSGGKIISSTTSSSRPVQLAQIKSTIFTELSKCIISGACRPLMGSEGDDRIQGGSDSNAIIGL